MKRPEGFTNWDRKVQKRPCRDCWERQAQCSTFTPGQAQPVRRCVRCWGAYYMERWQNGLREAYRSW